jgi:Protein of unknown function (DUF3738)
MMMTSRIGDRSRITGEQTTMQALARSLGAELKTTVRDGTGLTAKYDFTLTYASPEWGRLAAAPCGRRDRRNRMSHPLQKRTVRFCASVFSTGSILGALVWKVPRGLCGKVCGIRRKRPPEGPAHKHFHSRTSRTVAIPPHKA